MICKGICLLHRARRPSGSFGRYATGQKRCQICNIFLRWDGLRCPCCGCKVRTRPRNSKSKKELEIIRKKHNENKDKQQQPLLIYKKSGFTANSSCLFVN